MRDIENIERYRKKSRDIENIERYRKKSRHIENQLFLAYGFMISPVP
ncbi:hypothetical protein MmTuc01_1995 [Methanosarcina mazei Tuc01]|uniref:Uncharacterized protein n=1 Tax=Methanosarcina mazei Tuc01 TaxID=1236903 RepID=M1QAT3_METMZ|nr:hypothetical protein MmTuc01_1995 [Methanosarcina mazei Tuc01]